MLNRLLIGVSLVSLPLFALATGCGDDDDDSTAGGRGGTAGYSGSSGAGGTAGRGGSSGASGAGGTAGRGGSSGTSGWGGSAGASSDASDASDASCGPTGPLTTPAVPAGLEAPAGATLVARYHVTGDQIYTCTASGADGGSDAGTTYVWVLKAPSATLYDSACRVAGTHYAGPSWKSSDGSSAVGALVASAPSPNAGAIPLLLLKVTATSGEGIFATVTAVQRLDTVGGRAPAQGCTAGAVGNEAEVPYTATYYFYTGGSFPGDASAEAADAKPD
jgi:hypothetical protein